MTGILQTIRDIFLKDISGNKINPAKEDGNILSIKNQSDKVDFDSFDNSIVSIDIEHHMIHEGYYFTTNLTGTSKNAGQTINIYLKTPVSASLQWHAVFKWAASGAGYGRIYEAPTITSNTGSPLLIVNKNRQKTINISSVLDNATSPVANYVSTDVTKTGNGTILYVEYAGAAKSEGAQGRAELEYILKSNTVYLFEVESDAAGLTLNLQVKWYEMEAVE